jgi:hypothetical protein
MSHRVRLAVGLVAGLCVALVDLRVFGATS